MSLDNSCGTAIMCNCETEYMKRRTRYPRAGTSDLMWGAEMWCTEACSIVIGSCPCVDMLASITVQHVEPLSHRLFTDPRASLCRHMRSNSPFTVLGICLLTFLSTLQELAMDIRWLSLLTSNLDPLHPFGSYSRFVPDGCASGALSRTLPGLRSERGPKSTACAATRRPRGEYAVKSFRFLGKGASTGLQA